MDDIVERLLESAELWANEVDTRIDAAKEIKRLRAELADALRAQDPIATVEADYKEGDIGLCLFRGSVKFGDNFYKAPVPSVPEGYLENYERGFHDGYAKGRAAAYDDDTVLDARRYRALRNCQSDFPAVYASPGADDTDWIPIDGVDLDYAADELLTAAKEEK